MPKGKKPKVDKTFKGGQNNAICSKGADYRCRTAATSDCTCDCNGANHGAAI